MIITTITVLIASGIIGFIVYLIARKKTTFENSLGIALMTGAAAALILLFTLLSIIEDKGDIVVKSREKIASTEEAVSVIEKGWVYKHDEDNQIIRYSIDDFPIYVDESVDGLYIEKRYWAMGIFKTDTDEVLVIPEYVEDELQENSN